jgi:hypothetical protein
LVFALCTQALDKDRRALEFALLERDLAGNKKKLEEVGCM